MPRQWSPTEGGASPGGRPDSEHKARWRRQIRVGGAHDERSRQRKGACIAGVSERRASKSSDADWAVWRPDGQMPALEHYRWHKGILSG
jgi:hypothetical protein